MSNVRLHYEDTAPGEVPVMLLAPSLGTTLALWDPQVRALAERLRVVRFDLRSHGRSPVPPAPYDLADLGADVLGLMDELAVERASFCGVSIGGMLGMWLAATAPERIERLVLVCTAAHLPPASAWAERAAAVRTAGTTEAVADTVVERWVTPAFAREHPDVVARLRAMLVAQPPDGYAACCGAIERMDLRDALQDIAAPTLVVAGAEDAATPPDHARAIAGAIPGARLEILSPAAHLASVERASEVTDLILDHCLEAA